MLVVFKLYFFFCRSYGQYRISGSIQDFVSGETIIGASVYDIFAKTSTNSNQYGFFSVKTESSATKVRISHIGYIADTITLTLTKDTNIVFVLKPFILEEVIIRQQSQERNTVGSFSLPIARLKSLPMLLGEKDLLKALAATPGISTGQEGSAGLYVRGGTPDQNLILLDEAPVYNVSHLFGFLSVFNPDALKNVTVYKAGFPARFGGRLSSVIDVNMRDGNNKSKQGEWGIGLINSRFLMEGPLKRNKTSYLISARTTNIGLFTMPQRILVELGKANAYNSYWLYDLNAKVNHRINDKNHFFFSIYSGYDFYSSQQTNRQYNEQLKLNWGNLTSTLRYSRIFTPKLFGRAVVTYSHFIYNFNTSNTTPLPQSNETSTTSRQSQSAIKDWSIKLGFDYVHSSSYTLKTGLETTYHQYEPNLSREIIDNEIASVNDNKILAYEQAMYVENEYQPSKWLILNGGFRTTLFSVTNKTYHSIEPRLSINFLLPKDWAIKMGSSQMQQYIHLLTNNGIGFSNDIWVPATDKAPPQRAQQVALEIIREWPKYGIEFSAGGYYKTMNGLIDFRQGNNILGSYQQDWQDAIEINGIGRAYGAEFFLNKKQGKFTGWLSYTLAWSERKFAKINNGAWYPQKYDRRHNFTAILNYKLSSKWSFASNWVFQTGHAVTLPKANMIDVFGLVQYIYEGRNQFRMPNYHRLDIAFTKTYVRKNNKEAGWSFGVYNVYNRQNPYLLDIKTLSRFENNIIIADRVEIRQLSLIPFLPYVGHHRKF